MFFLLMFGYYLAHGLTHFQNGFPFFLISSTSCKVSGNLDPSVSGRSSARKPPNMETPPIR